MNAARPEHDPEKWVPLFGKGSCSTKRLERDDDSKGSHPAPATTSDGFILVAVLWIIGSLAALAAIYAVYVGNTAAAVAVNDAAVEAEALLSASVELTAGRLLAAPADRRPTRGAFNFRLGHAVVAVDFCSEAARLDLNAAPKDLLTGIFRVLGATPDNAAQYADRIVGWRTAPSADAQDSEGSLYRAAGLDYGPRRAPFAHVGELRLVLGLPPAMVDRALSFVTVFSGREDVNVLDAAPEVVAALPRPSAEANSDSGKVPSGGSTQGSDAVRVTARIAFDNGRRLVSEAVILIEGRDEPFRVLSWQEDIDPMPDRAPSARLRR